MSKILRQSAAELLALSVIDLFPGALLVEAIATEQGFYCDILAKQPIDDNAVPLIEEKMRAFAKQNLEVRTLEMMRENGADYLEHHGQPIRAEAAREAKENIISIVQIGSFCDYCLPPYVSGTKELEFFKILTVEKIEDIKRIHGIVSHDKAGLKKSVKAWQAGKKADHTKYHFFSLQSEVSEIAWSWNDRGAQLKDCMVHWWKKEHLQQKFMLLSTPSLIKESLSKKWGMGQVPPITEIEGTPYVIAPSATPAHLAFFQQKPRSFNEMPIRYAELAPLIFQEKTSSLWGLFDSHLVSADYAHMFCTPEQLPGELISSLQFIDKIIKMFGFEYCWHLKGKRQKEKAEKYFISAFEKTGFVYTHIEETSFAGWVAETRLIDRFGREWKGPYVALDLHAPDRFGLRYKGPDEKLHVPLMLARSVFGSLERFAALLLEHTSGQMPSWLMEK
jgi:threonyl-tRNA synthetase